MENISLTIETTSDGVIDVPARLKDLKAWKKEWEVEDQALANQLYALGDSKHDMQRGVQIEDLRRILQYQLIRKPIDIEEEVLKRLSVTGYRQLMANQFAALGEEQKKLWLYNFLFLLTPDLRKLIQLLDGFLTPRMLEQSRGLLVEGVSGMGKSTVLYWYSYQHIGRVEEEYNFRPVVIADAPVNNKTIIPLLQRIVQGCGKTYLVADRDEDLLDRIIVNFPKCRVSILILDEIQHLKKHEFRRRVLEIMNRTRNVSIVCASCQPKEFTNGDVELQGRFNNIYSLTPYTGKKLIQLLVILNILLPFPESSDLHMKSIRSKGGNIEGPAAFIEKATGGVLRYIMLLVTEASILAIEGQKSKITKEILQEAWKSIVARPVVDFMELFRLIEDKH